MNRVVDDHSKRIAIVGAGISGISAGALLKRKGYHVEVFERNDKPGGLVRCDVVEENLFHRVGGHVFNARDKDVSDWFWSHFDREQEFITAQRNAKILLGGKLIGYPLENHLYSLDDAYVKKIVSELLALHAQGYRAPFEYENFAAFLRGNFGETLYHLYFKPYNEKIWRTDLEEVPMHWLEGKLPMPDFNGIFSSNITRAGEQEMVHSTFYYARQGGSQFIVDRLANGLKINCLAAVKSIRYASGEWIINGDQRFGHVVYTGDVRLLHNILSADGAPVQASLKSVAQLKSNGTSNMLCETDHTDLSWLYLPGPETKAHRIIYTGNFSHANNALGKRKTCVVEFSGTVDRSEIMTELTKLPGNLKPIAYNHEPNSYIIQEHDTRDKVQNLKSLLQPMGFYLTGRFAEWEYYNMDKAIKSSLALDEYL